MGGVMMANRPHSDPRTHPALRAGSPLSRTAGEGAERSKAGEGEARIAYGGKGLYGARVGILMLETRFPRIPGDMGNAETWPFPVLYKVVPGASPRRVVRDRAAGLL